MLEGLERIAERQEIVRVAYLNRIEPDARRGPWERECARLWILAERRAEELGLPALDAIEVAAPSGKLVLVRKGSLVAGALTKCSAVGSIIRYELADALAD